jgi:pimeloyl-ACP methyl ester carboxylesterase
MTPSPRLCALLAAALLLGAACSGGKGGAKSGAGAAATQTDVTAARDWATPVTLPVTPATPAWHTVNPQLDALPGAHSIVGTYSGGAYEIEVPDAWDGDVVYFAHGFRGGVLDLTVSQPPLRQYLIDHGYAWAASSYSANGYAPGVGAADTYALRDVFTQKVGAPKHSYLYGQSMGGNVATVSLERYPTAYDGALTECGSLSGQGIVDYFLSWGALAGYFSDTEIAGVTSDAGALGQVLRNKVGPVLGTPKNLTDKGKAFASAIENMTGGPRPFFNEGFGANYILNFLILVQAVAAPGAANAVAQNADTQYAVAPGLGIDNAALNGKVERVRANPVYQDQTKYPEFGAPTGKIQRPILTLHGTGDLFVPMSMEQIYRRAVDAAGAGDLLVQRAIRRPGHCAFTNEERVSAFEDLVAWVTQGKKPAGEDITGDLTDAGRAFTNPLLADDPGGVAP